MSLSAEGRIIYCDGAGCCASVPAPVALHPPRAAGRRETTPNASGWLFVGHQHATRHYCPCCIPHYLALITEKKHQSVETAASNGDAV